MSEVDGGVLFASFLLGVLIVWGLKTIGGRLRGDEDPEELAGLVAANWPETRTVLG